VVGEDVADDVVRFDHADNDVSVELRLLSGERVGHGHPAFWEPLRRLPWVTEGIDTTGLPGGVSSM